LHTQSQEYTGWLDDPWSGLRCNSCYKRLHIIIHRVYVHYNVTSAPISSSIVTEFGPVFKQCDFSGHEIRDSENSGASGTYCGEDKCVQNFGWET
jgi:hypothetical protein